MGWVWLALRESNPFGLKRKIACLTVLKKLDNSLIACTFLPCNPTYFLVWNCSHLRTNKSVEDFFELWCRQLKNFQIKGRTKAHGFIVPRQKGSIPVRLATANLYWTRFGAANKAIYRTKKPCWFFNHLRFFSLSMSLFARSKFANNLLTHYRRGDFNWERRRNIRIFQVFIDWKAPAIMCYRRVQYRLAVASHFFQSGSYT